MLASSCCVWLALAIGLHFLSQGRVQDARMQFENALDIEGNNFPAVLGKAAAAFREKKWAEARSLYANVLLALCCCFCLASADVCGSPFLPFVCLMHDSVCVGVVWGFSRSYAKAIRMHPACPASVRVGLGMCLFKLGHIDIAKKSMQRALDLDPNNVDALASLAVLERYHRPKSAGQSVQQEAEALAKAMELVVKGYVVKSLCPRCLASTLTSPLLLCFLGPLGRTTIGCMIACFFIVVSRYKINRTHPLVCNQLAHHVFWKWHELTSTASVTSGSAVVELSGAVNTMLQTGHPVRIGMKHLGNVASVSGSTLTLTEAFSGSTASGVRVFHRKFDLAMELAKTAMKGTKNQDVIAESCYIVGRCHHAIGNFDQAHVWYSKSLRTFAHPVLCCVWFVCFSSLCFAATAVRSLIRLRAQASGQTSCCHCTAWHRPFSSSSGMKKRSRASKR